ncbi:HTTM domain-containing protein [Schlesneria sp. T3-172]|uniref:HTTM domain-containing protein n=1 Tax=Schlesneria sphaerica TaxID=3373610 RepID=UPI0037C87AE7
MSIAETHCPRDVPPADASSCNKDCRAWLFAPVDIASLVYFRILFGAIMVYHVVSTIKSGWIDQLYIRPVMHFTYPGFGWVHPWPGSGMYWHFGVMGVAATGILLGAFYRLSALVFAVGMAHVFLIEKAFYLNHYYLIVLLSGLLVFLPAHHALSVDAWLRSSLRSQVVSAWTLWLLRLQIGIPYFYGGLAKLDSDWLQGYPLGMWLKRRSDLPWVGASLAHEYAGIAFAWGGMLLDLLIVPLLLWKRTRWTALAVGVLFHLMNSVLFEIGIFPWLMIGATLLFFPPDWPRRFVLRSRLTPEAGLLQPVSPFRQNMTLGLLGVYVVWQLLFPFRGLFYTQPATWSEEGHHFAWHMMLREKDVGLRFYIRDPRTGEGGVADLRTFLTSRQLSRMSKDSDMILTFVHFLRDHFRAHGKGTLQIRVLALVSLNGRRPQLMMDPDLDYARVERTWFPQPWILPLTEPLRREPWTVPLEEWEQHVFVPSPEEMIQPAPRQVDPFFLVTPTEDATF